MCEAASSNPNDEALVGALTLESFAAGSAALRASDGRMLKYAQGRSERLAELFQEAVGQAVRVSVQAPRATDAAQPMAPAGRVSEREAERIPLIRQAMEIFGARVVSVEAARERE